MAKKVFFIECSVPFWLEVAEQLQRLRGWEPVYWTGIGSFQDPVVTRFPEICFHVNYDAVKGIAPPSYRSLALPPLDQTLLKDLAECERNAVWMMERMDPDESFTYTGRVRLFHRHVRYWQAVLERLRPDAIVMPNSPHLVYDYVLYALCQRLGIATILFNESSVDGLIYPVPAFERGSDQLMSAYRRLLNHPQREAELMPTTERYLAKVQGDYNQGRPAYLEGLYENRPAAREATQRPRVSILKKLKSCVQGVRRRLSWVYLKSKIRRFQYAYQIAHVLKRRGALNPVAVADALNCTHQFYQSISSTLGGIPDLSGPLPLSYLTSVGEPPEKASYTGAEYWLFRLMAGKKKERLRQRYDSLATPLDLRQPYVYLALHYQPEKSTCPEGGVFANQYLVVDLLSKCVPPGWQVFVKEHPFQFEFRGSGELTRTTQFYDDVAALPNVRFVPMDVSPFDLIDHARAVATVTGTSGWEGRVRGKPVLVFGHAWYKGCDGVFHVPTEMTCRAALQQIAGGFVPDAHKLRLFVRALEEICVRGYTIPELAESAGISHSENVLAFTHAIEQSLLQKQAA